MDISKYVFSGSRKYERDTIDSGDTSGVAGKKQAKALLAKNIEKIAELQNRLYAQSSQSLLIVIQAMDAAGKDGLISHVFTGVNPQGISVTNFRQPSSTELAHDFLWRVHPHVPAKGQIAIFNRSHYEDVLAARVLHTPEAQNLPPRVMKDFWKNRYRQICDFERMLFENGTSILKLYLHLSRQEQNARFLARLEEPSKNYKFSQGDLDTSRDWDRYMKAFRVCINETSAPHAPWYVLPADHKWYTRYLASEIVRKTLRRMRPEYPKLGEEERQKVEEYRIMLSGNAEADK